MPYQELENLLQKANTDTCKAMCTVNIKIDDMYLEPMQQAQLFTKIEIANNLIYEVLLALRRIHDGVARE